MIDGEYVAEDGFHHTLSEHKKGQGNGVFWAFDMMPLAYWRTGRCDMPIERRLAWLNRLAIEQGDSLFVGALNHWVLDGYGAKAKRAEIWASGGEGTVEKMLGSAYVRDRDATWVRHKQTLTFDLPIVDVMVKNDALRVMVVRGPDASIPTIHVATGWTADEGRAIAKEVARAPYSLIAEISFQLSTGARRSVRGARFHRLRTDKSTKGARA